MRSNRLGQIGLKETREFKSVMWMQKHVVWKLCFQTVKVKDLIDRQIEERNELVPLNKRNLYVPIFKPRCKSRKYVSLVMMKCKTTQRSSRELLGLNDS